MKRFIVVVFMVLVSVLAIIPALAQDDTGTNVNNANQATPIWQTSNDLRSALLDAQLELFAARRADDPTVNYQNAITLIDDALAHYTDTLQPTVAQFAPQSDRQIMTVFADAQRAVADVNAEELALARGTLWTTLLHASYQTTLSALDAGDLQTAEAWLSLREYRQATRVTIVLSPSAGAIDDLRDGVISSEEAYAIVENDLRDSYYFRLRQAATELQSALETDYPIRSAEWLGQLEGYFSIFADDYATQLGNTVAVDSLGTLQTEVMLSESETALQALDAFRVALIDYQPVALTDEQITERGQLLYIFTDLTYIEYKDAVRNGEITIPIEYQEATTFLEQARSTFDELRPTIAEADLENAQRLNIILGEMQTILVDLGDSALVRELSEEAKRLISDSLPLDLNNGTVATFTIVNALLNDVETAFADGRYNDAENIRLQAYALFDFGPEQRLLAFSPNLAVEIDALFWHGDGNGNGLARMIAARASLDDLQAVRAELSSALEEAQIILGASTQPLTIIFNSAIIVFREGLEAVVIIAALSAGMIKVNTAYRRPLYLGALGAFLFTGFTFVIADAFLSLFRDFGERLEAVVSLVALAMLLVITNWFFHKVYWKDHLAGFHQRKGRLLSGEAGRYLGLMLLGFTSIYREGFETVLFLQALVLDAGALVVLQGVLLGLTGVGIIGVFTFKMQTRLPYMKMMVVTGILIGAVLVMLVGNTVRVMQVVAWIPVSPIEGISFPYWWGQWFGVYPTWEGIVAQVGAAVFTIGSYFLAENQSKQARRKKSPETKANTNQPAPKASLANGVLTQVKRLGKASHD